MSASFDGTPRWLSSNPDKAWAERWLLGYSAAWMLAVALVIATVLRRLTRAFDLGAGGRLVVALGLGHAIALLDTFAMASDALWSYLPAVPRATDVGAFEVVESVGGRCSPTSMPARDRRRH